jgi:FtsP/CotA-like multicopper oxidase with cupredoxin domain
MLPVLVTLSLRPSPPTVIPNDNRTPAGRLAGDSLTLNLDIQYARWLPEADNGAAIEVAAFGEAGEAPRIPGPLIRVRTGTTIIATVRNRLPDSTATVHGLGTRPGFRNRFFTLAPGEQRTIRFEAGDPGTYLYWAEAGAVKLVPGPLPGLQIPDREREQLAGAFVIDPAEGSPPDRVFVINIWGSPVDAANSEGGRGGGDYRNALAINGRSWPYTERLAATVGDSIRWRVVNGSTRPHPMHLHGVYFRVDAKGSGIVDTAYDASIRRLAVTEVMNPRQTMSMVWRPDRPGNWLFHCHLMFHALHTARLDPTSHDMHSGDADKHMAGLVLGISARPRPGDPVERRDRPTRLRLHVTQGPPRGRSPHAMSFVLQQGSTPPASDSVRNPGSLLVLTRGQPTDITVLNHMKEGTSVHWHGIELESWSDGVPGWSGEGQKLAPTIAPGDSFVARLTLPRAGTFMYHTHLNDIEQVTSGLYGPIIVLEPGQRYDPTTDHVFLFSWSGAEEPPQFMMNGDSVRAPLKFKAGVTHRLRFINIAPAGNPRVWLVRDSVPEKWKPVAKDGADLPPAQAIGGLANVDLDVGETYDFEWKPPAPGPYELRTGPRRSILLQRIIVE